jgi:hypothetical protein
MSLFGRGFVPGESLSDRIAAMTDPASWSTPDRRAKMGAGFERAKAVQRSIAEAARAAFGGRITYAAGGWEQVEWDLFDIVSIDAYRDANNAARYREQIRGYTRFGKPVAITEFGCCTYAGAAAAGGTGWMILDLVSSRPQLTGVHHRDEVEQVRYFHELMEVFDAEGVDSAFWFSFAGFALPTGTTRHGMSTWHPMAYGPKTRLCVVLSKIAVFVRGSLIGCAMVWIHFRFSSSLLPGG